IARRQQFYGEMYYHTAFKSKVLQGASGATSTNENSNMMKWLNKTMPYFEEEGLHEKPTQVLINEYKNNMGIASHFEDIDSFGPMICTISLIAPIYMTLKKPTTNDASNSTNSNTNACDVYDDVVKILLEPGSLLIMKSDARYKYRHGIGKYKWITIPTTESKSESNSVDGDETDGNDNDNENDNDDNNQNKNADQSSSPTPLPSSKDDNSDGTTSTNKKTNTSNSTNTDNNVRNIRRIKRDDSYRRVSVTIRHLLSTRRKVYHENEDESNTIKDPNVY
ncbi:hypothetical protein FRACYDRAFT_201639, partial [Fragilariopsis cylindrus CCMP1102]